MAQKYPENTLYKKMIDVSQSLGKATRDAKQTANRPSTTQTNQSGNISKYKNIPQNLSNLGTMTTPYGGSTRYEQTHPGVDIANKIGTPIPSYTGGTVTDIRSGKSQGDPGYGNYTIVTTPQGDKVRYSHLDQAYVRVGQELNPGDVLGSMGNTGQTYSISGGDASHLDLRIKNAYGKYVNPLSYLGS